VLFQNRKTIQNVPVLAILLWFDFRENVPPSIVLSFLAILLLFDFRESDIASSIVSPSLVLYLMYFLKKLLNSLTASHADLGGRRRRNQETLSMVQGPWLAGSDWWHLQWCQPQASHCQVVDKPIDTHTDKNKTQ
jgi:hypothetical protein